MMGSFMARLLKCAEANRLFSEHTQAVARYGETVRDLPKNADRESPEFYRAWMLSKEAEQQCSLTNWHYKRHREKHKC
jgi:hypothetical protein